MIRKIVKLSDVINLQNGYAFKSKEYSSDGYFVMRITNVQKGYISNHNPRYIQIKSNSNFAKFILKENDILLSLTGDVGRVGIIKKQHLPCVLNQRVAKIKIKDKTLLNKDFLFLFLNSDIFLKKVEKLAHGSAQNNVSTKDILNINFNLPSITEQQSISTKLNAAFAEIDKTIYLDEQKLLKINLFRQTLLKSEFDIDFKKTILNKVVKYDKQNGQGSKLPYIGMENISSETMNIVGEIDVPEKTSSTFKFNNSHVLFGRLRPYLKKVLIPNFEGQCSTEIFCLKPTENINKNFLAYWLLSPNISNKINNSSTGARMPRANMNDLLDYQFPVLSLSQQQKIVTKIDKAFATLDNIKKIIEKKIANYQSLKLSILSQEIRNKAV